MTLIITAIITIWLYMTCGYIYALVRKRNDIVDSMWGGGFIIIAIVALWHQGEPTLPMIILASMIGLWGLRLLVHITMRNTGASEDARYRTWRDAWMEHGRGYFLIRSYFQIFILQGFLMLLMSVPVFILSIYAQVNAMTWYMYIGIGIWVIGFFFETVGDWQLQRFIRDKTHKGAIMKYGLWKYTRHPNYFGEIAMWWGIGIMVAPSTLPVSAIALLSPLIITYLLLYVSGIPMLEKKWDDNLEFQEYKKQTSPLIPWFSSVKKQK